MKPETRDKLAEAARRQNRCPRCGNQLGEPREHPDGLPGLLYRECSACGYVRPVTSRAKRESL